MPLAIRRDGAPPDDTWAGWLGTGEVNGVAGLGQRAWFVRGCAVLAILALALLSVGTGSTQCRLLDQEVSAGNTFRAWVSLLWRQTTQADFAGGVLASVDLTATPGDVKLAASVTRDVYAFRGAGTPDFWRYDMVGNTWSAPPVFSPLVKEGGSLAYDGSGGVYYLRGAGTKAFGRYDTGTGSWTPLASTPAIVKEGGALACDGSNYVYALAGNNTTAFWRYDITNDSWTAMASAPAAVREGGALVRVGTNAIYALQGNAQKAFWRYDIAANSWTAMAPTAQNVRWGGALTYDGARYVYAFRGDGKPDFWRYDTTTNSWVTTPLVLAPAPTNVQAGGSLAYDGAGGIFAFAGNGTTTYWRYDIAGNTWAVKAVAPAKVDMGGALVPLIQTVYATSGTVASRVLDAARVGAAWNALGWDRTLAAGTTITFEVRASDTAFAADAAAPAWAAVGDTSPVISALPAGRYKQIRATLGTTDLSRTPALHEFRLYHY